MKYLIKTDDHTTVVKEKYEQVAFDVTNGLVYCIDKQEEIELVSVFIDDTEYELYPNKTFAEQGYDEMWVGEDHGCGYKYFNCVNEYPNEGGYYYSTEPVATIYAYIDDSRTELNPNQTFADQGYEVVGYVDCGWYDVNSSTDYPNEDRDYYTYSGCMVYVTINNNPEELNHFKTLSNNGYSTIYDIDNSMKDCSDEKPSESIRYSTDCPTILIDASETLISSYYTFSDQGYSTMYDVTNSMNECSSENPSDGCKYSTSSVNVYIDNSGIQMSPSYVFNEQGYSTIYNMDDSMSGCADSTPSEGGNYSTASITVSINASEISVSPYYEFYNQGYGTMYNVDNSMSDCSYDYPYEGGKYSTDSIDVLINNTTTAMSSYYTFSDQDYDTMYDVDNSMSDCSSENPYEGGKYSTDSIDVLIDNTTTAMSSSYVFSDQGYSTMYDVTNSMGDCSNDYPSVSNKYSTDSIDVLIDNSTTAMSSYYTFSDQDYDTMYNASSSMSDCSSESPSTSDLYSTDYIVVSIDGEDTQISGHYTFEEQGYTTIFGKDNCGSEITHDASSYPQENWTYYTTEPQITVTIDNESVDVYQYQTFAEQGYADIYKEVEGEDIDCADDYPEEGVEYWTT